MHKIMVKSPDGLVVQYIEGSRAFPGLARPASDTDLFEITQQNWNIRRSTLNLGYSDRCLLILWLPKSCILQTSETWGQLVGQRDSLLVQPRLRRLKESMATRLNYDHGQHGKAWADILRRAWQVTALIDGSDPYLLPDRELSLLVDLRNGKGFDTAEQWRQDLQEHLQDCSLAGFPLEDSEVVNEADRL